MKQPSSGRLLQNNNEILFNEIFIVEASQTNGLKIALIQLSVCMDKSKNIAEAVKQIYFAKLEGAQVIILPECFNSPYGTNYFNEYAESIPDGETSKALSEVAALAGVCVVGGTMPERCGDKLYNTSTVWGCQGQLLAKHRKMHLFDVDIPNKIHFKESEILSEGHQLTTFEYCGVKIGLGICHDLRFYEMTYLMAQKGCSLLIYPAAFEMMTGQKLWELMGRARACDQQVWVALASPARNEAASYVALGHSMIVNPWGEVVAKLDEKPGLIISDIDLDMVNEIRHQIPMENNRRTDVYETVLMK